MLFYENRWVGEVTAWEVVGTELRLSTNLGLLPGMVVQLATSQGGTRSSGLVDISSEGTLYIRLEGVLL